jgi:hypothetical protein
MQRAPVELDPRARRRMPDDQFALLQVPRQPQRVMIVCGRGGRGDSPKAGKKNARDTAGPLGFARSTGLSCAFFFVYFVASW